MGSFGISEGNITSRETHTHNTHRTATPSREVAQMLVLATSERGLDREAGAGQGGAGCMLRVRPRLNDLRTI